MEEEEEEEEEPMGLETILLLVTRPIIERLCMLLLTTLVLRINMQLYRLR